MKFNQSIIFFVIIISAFAGCDKIVDIDEKPAVMERHTELKIRVKDNSGYMEKLFGADGVPGAEVFFKSNSFGFEYHLTTDSSGIAAIDGIISDTYLVTASRLITEAEMEQITGIATSNYKLVNKTTGTIELRADMTEPVELAVDISIGGSPIVISEIYGCGPPGAGLYFHDKYIELYNQTDSTVYLDSLIVAVVYASSYLGLNFIDDPEFVHSTSVWMIPGNGTQFPLEPGEFAVCAEDAIDHRTNAPNSVDQSGVRLEFYKKDAPDIDNPNVPNLKRIYQEYGYDWLIGGESEALVIAKIPPAKLQRRDERLLIPYSSILDGVEYLADPSRLDKKTLNLSIDAGATGGIEFYTGKSMERIMVTHNGRNVLKDDNNSSLDFVKTNGPTVETHYSF
jgi:hypothetical protein